MRIDIAQMHDLTGFTMEELEASRDEAMLGIRAIKQKLLRLPKNMPQAKTNLLSAKMAYGTIHQATMAELGRRHRKNRDARAHSVERCFVDLAKARLPVDVFQDLLDEAVDKTREES